MRSQQNCEAAVNYYELHKAGRSTNQITRKCNVNCISS